APRELALIIAKAAARDPAQRYDSAAAFADDLRRWLRHEPISARRPSSAYVFRKWSRRNPGVLASGLAAILATLVGLAAFAWQARVAQRASATATREARTVEAVVSFIESTFGSVDGRASGPQAKIADVLDLAAATNVRQNADEPEVMARLASLFGRSYLSLGLRAPAEKQLRLAVATFPDPRTEHALVARQFLANVLRRSKFPAEAVELARAVYQDQLALRGPDHPDTLFAVRGYGLACAAIGDTETARTLLTRAAEGYGRSLGPNDPSTLHARAEVARFLIQSGEPARAIDLLEPDYEHALSSLKTNHPVTLNIVARLASAHIAAGSPARAEQLCAHHYASVCEALGQAHPHSLSLALELGRAQLALGRTQDAIATLKAAEASANRPGADDELELSLRAQLARALWSGGETARASQLAAAIDAADTKAPRLPLTASGWRAKTLEGIPR
ncbi:MAG: tetratricopeptide repeat protein, partial [Phycisphaerales bacterium]